MGCHIDWRSLSWMHEVVGHLMQEIVGDLMQEVFRDLEKLVTIRRSWNEMKTL